MSITKWFMEVQDSSVINVVMKAHKKTSQNGTWKQNIELYHIGVTTKGESNEHYKVVHGGTRFKCDKCSYEGTRKDKLKPPMETEHGTVLYWCDLCNEF